jgi:predicted acetyltransferase
MYMPTIKVILATKNQQSIIAQLYELYTYEMTYLADFDINETGFYGYKALPSYWIDTNKFPYLVWVDNKLAGFVLVQQGSPIENNPNIWDVAEFFIMHKFRKKGISQSVAITIFKMKKGTWQVRVWDGNKRAHIFWDKVIATYSKKQIIPTKRQEDEHDLIYTFNSN